MWIAPVNKWITARKPGIPWRRVAESDSTTHPDNEGSRGKGAEPLKYDHGVRVQRKAATTANSGWNIHIYAKNPGCSRARPSKAAHRKNLCASRRTTSVPKLMAASAPPSHTTEYSSIIYSHARSDISAGLKVCIEAYFLGASSWVYQF